MDVQSLLDRLNKIAAEAGLGGGPEGAGPEGSSDVPAGGFFDDECPPDYEDPDWPMRAFSRDFKVIGAPSIDIVAAEDLTPLLFLREYVAKSRPVLIDGALEHWNWPALSRWQDDAYLRRAVGDAKVTIDFTPDGKGDCIVEDRLFVTPVEEKMHFKDFLGLLREDGTAAGALEAVRRDTAEARTQALAAAAGAKAAREAEAKGESPEAVAAAAAAAAAAVTASVSSATGADAAATVGPRLPEGVPYCQHQNGSFEDEFAPLHGDAPLHVPMADEAFGEKPEAVNFWMGDGRASSSLHSDPFENLYAVVRGTKHFTLLPPSDHYWLSRKSLPCAKWVRGLPPTSAPAHPLYKAGTDTVEGGADVDEDRAAAEADAEAAAAAAEGEEEGDEEYGSNGQKLDIDIGGLVPSANEPVEESAAATALRRRIAARKARVAAAAAAGGEDPILDLEDVPADVPAVVGRFHTQLGEGGVDAKVPWVDVDVDAPRPGDGFRCELGELTKHHVTVRKGQALYLPAQWFHAVRQEGVTIAVNYWYPMQYDGRSLHVELVRALKEQRDRRE